ncbi:MAG TPA: protein-methionine-sulfoxide reductase heme-binding subunit MsrQ [Anaerolineales bacterium]|nr:protein-methionine-sulfoxide reductase heme-binding subunit MsrQ [Anaerolineales bacterium]
MAEIRSRAPGLSVVREILDRLRRPDRIVPPGILQALVHIGCLAPFALLIRDYFTGNLSANPIQEATLRTGKTALTLLVLSLACTPAGTYLRFTIANRFRRPLGLYAFFYAAIHFLIFIWVDLGLNWAFIVEGFIEKPYALIGFAAFLLLIPLAVTSTKGWQRRLGVRWKRLHRLVYVVAGLVILHYIWVVKSDIREPLLWGGGVVLLLLLRNRVVKTRLLRRNR